MNTASIVIKIAGKKLTTDEVDNLVSFKVSASIQSAAVAKIKFVDKTVELQEKTIFNIGNSVSVSIGEKGKEEEIFIGDIVRVDYLFSTDEASSIQIICYDGLYRLSKIWHSRAFVKMKLSDIAKKMAGEAKLTGSQIEATTPAIEHLYQNNQSNLDFLRMHAKRIGYEVGIEKGGLFFKKARFKKKTKSNITLVWGESLIELNAKVDSSDVLAEVVVSSWDPDTKKNVEASVKAGSEDKVASPKTMGAKEVKSKSKSEAKLYRLGLPNLTAAEAKSVASWHLTQASMNYLKVEGICVGEPKFKLGSMLEIKGVGKKISGEYYINAFEHIYGKHGYKTSFEVQANGTF